MIRAFVMADLLTARRGMVALVLATALVFIVAGALGTRWALVAGDGYQQALPLHVLVARMWRAGQLPAWNPYAFSGSPLMADGIAGVWYLPNVLFLVLPPVAANNVTLLASFAVAAAGAYVFARHLTDDRVAGLVSALAFAGSGFFLGHVVHQAILASACWLPWAIYGVERCRTGLSARYLALGAGALAMAELAGQAQTFAMVAMAVIIYGLLMTGRKAIRALVGAVVVVVTGTALSAVQLVPTLAVLGHEDFRLSYDVARQYSFPLSHLPLLVFPYLFGSAGDVFPYLSAYRGAWNLDELNGYVGAAALVFAVIGLRTLRRDRRAVALCGLGVVGVVLASAGGWPIGRLLYLVPVYGNFRDWARYVLFTDMAVAALAAFGVAELRRGDWVRVRAAKRSAAATAAGVVLGAIVVHVVGPMRRLEVHGLSGWAAVGIPASAAIAAAVVAVLLARRSRVGAVLAVLLVSADAMAASFGAWRPDVKPANEVTSALSVDAQPSWGPRPVAAGGITRFMFAGTRTVYSTDSYPDLSDTEGLRSANGYVPFGLAPKAYTAAVGNMDYEGNVPNPSALWTPDSHLLDLLRITTVVFDPQATSPTPGPDADVTFGSHIAGGLVRYEHRPRLPDAFVVGEVNVRSRAAVLAAVSGSIPWDPSSLALTETGCLRCPRGPPGSAGTVVDERWTFDGFAAHVDSTRTGILVVSQSWFPGWRATVDYRAVPVIRVDGLLQGVPVPAGAHQVVLTYHAPGLGLGLLITAVTAAILLGWGLASLGSWQRAIPRTQRQVPTKAGPSSR